MNHQSLSLPRNSWEHLTLPHLPLGFVLESRSPLRNPGYPTRPVITVVLLDDLTLSTQLDLPGCHWNLGSEKNGCQNVSCHNVMSFGCRCCLSLEPLGLVGVAETACAQKVCARFSLNQSFKERNTNCPTKTQEHTF